MLDMLKEGGVYSLTRVLPTLGYITFLVLSCYLAYTGRTWGHYTEFATATGGAIILQLGNKYINSVYNTPKGKVGKL